MLFRSGSHDKIENGNVQDTPLDINVMEHQWRKSLTDKMSLMK